MIIDKNIVKAEFIHRPNRFQAYVSINGEVQMVHVPNTGRCKEILQTGTTVILREESGPQRKTMYDLIAGYKGEKLIHIDSHEPNKIVDEALRGRKIPSLKKYNKIEREKTFGNSRFDFKLSNDHGEEYYLEVKGVTFEEKGKAMFPDAPTERGRKHLLELVEVKRIGKGAGVIFVIQMENINSFSPYDTMDKEFGEALRAAQQQSVELFAYNCSVSENEITLKDPVRINL
jgi:sugar fermentation stimulation protein A